MIDFRLTIDQSDQIQSVTLLEDLVENRETKHRWARALCQKHTRGDSGTNMLNPPKSISKLEHWNTTPVNIKIFRHPINPIPSNAFLCKMILYKIQSSEIIAKTLNRIDHKIIMLLSRPSSKRSNRAARGTRRLVAGRMDILSLEFPSALIPGDHWPLKAWKFSHCIYNSTNTPHARKLTDPLKFPELWTAQKYQKPWFLIFM